MSGKILLDQFMTLDGVVQAPGGPDEDRSGGFTHGGWQMPLFDEESGERMMRDFPHLDALLLGRRTYEIFANYWPKAPAEDPIAKKFNEVPKYVATRTLKRLDWQNSHILGADIKAEVAKIKAKHRNVHVIGSANFAQTLLREGLVDRLTLWVYPLTLGTGKKLFAEGTVPTAYKLAEGKVLANGSLYLVYEPAGKPSYAAAPGV